MSAEELAATLPPTPMKDEKSTTTPTVDTVEIGVPSQPRSIEQFELDGMAESEVTSLDAASNDSPSTQPTPDEQSSVTPDRPRHLQDRKFGGSDSSLPQVATPNAPPPTPSSPGALPNAHHNCTNPNLGRAPSCASSIPLIEIVSVEDLEARQAAVPASSSTDTDRLHSPEHLNRRHGARSASRARADTLKVSVVYNQYGELVDADTARRQPTPSELSVTQILRLIKKAYRHEFREKLGKIILLQMDAKESELATDDGTILFKERLSLWGLRKVSAPMSPNSATGPPVYRGPARVLEIGCGDGNWCFKVKKEQPDWIVEGVDDTDHWLCVNKGRVLKDFMLPATDGHPDDYFGKVHSTQEEPEFTVRNINSLLAHEHPIPHNLYGIIRGRDLFDRVESYKTFLEDVRSILQPDGVVEFVEIDTRPREMYFGGEQEEKQDHTSGPQTDWTDKIADRFKNPRDDELATTVPGWTGRVEARLNATLRPRDGVAAANLKSWLEGAGFWDVTQNIIQLPVGGSTPSGQLLKEFLLYKISLEDQIPKLRDELPAVEIEAMETGKFHLNLHIVTGRKPKEPRPGDLLMNGSRQEMTPGVYNAMVRFKDVKSSQWERFDFDSKLPKVMGSLKDLQGAPANVAGASTGNSFEAVLGRDASPVKSAVQALMRH